MRKSVYSLLILAVLAMASLGTLGALGSEIADCCCPIDLDMNACATECSIEAADGAPYVATTAIHDLTPSATGDVAVSPTPIIASPSVAIVRVDSSESVPPDPLLSRAPSRSPPVCA